MWKVMLRSAVLRIEPSGKRYQSPKNPVCGSCQMLSWYANKASFIPGANEADDESLNGGDGDIEFKPVVDPRFRDVRNQQGIQISLQLFRGVYAIEKL